MNTIESIVEWFKTAVPEPTDVNRAVQIGCHYEEVAEMAEALSDDFLCCWVSDEASFYKIYPVEAYWPGMIDKSSLLDSLADQIVTAIGVAYMHGYDIVGALAEVDRSNWSKFVDGEPVFDENGKIAKPSTYEPPNLEQFV